MIDVGVTILGARTTPPASGGRDAADGVGETTIIGHAQGHRRGQCHPDRPSLPQQRDDDRRRAFQSDAADPDRRRRDRPLGHQFDLLVDRGGRRQRRRRPRHLGAGDRRRPDHPDRQPHLRRLAGAVRHRFLGPRRSGSTAAASTSPSTSNIIEWTRTGLNLDGAGGSSASSRTTSCATSAPLSRSATTEDGFAPSDNNFRNVGNEYNFRNLPTDVIVRRRPDRTRCTPVGNPNDVVVILGGSGNDTLTGTAGRRLYRRQQPSRPI